VPGWAAGRLAAWDGTDERGVFTVMGEAAVQGHLPVAIHPDEQSRVAVVHDVWVEPSHRGRGYGRVARAFAEEWPPPG